MLKEAYCLGNASCYNRGEIPRWLFDVIIEVVYENLLTLLHSSEP